VSGVLIAAPMLVEQALIRSATRGAARVRKTGMGRSRSHSAASALARERGERLLVLGFCGGLDAVSVPGEVIVAEHVQAAPDEPGESEPIACDDAPVLAAAIAARGLQVRTGKLVSVSRIAVGERRAQLLEGGALAVDMESAWLAPGAAGRPFAVVRVVLDSPSHELLRPGAVVSAVRASGVLRRATAAVLQSWQAQGIR
jgi:4-hydroxy-3-methylbut-2-enyl diphosphate reductase